MLLWFIPIIVVLTYIELHPIVFICAFPTCQYAIWRSSYDQPACYLQKLLRTIIKNVGFHLIICLAALIAGSALSVPISIHNYSSYVIPSGKKTILIYTENENLFVSIFIKMHIIYSLYIYIHKYCSVLSLDKFKKRKRDFLFNVWAWLLLAVVRTT